MHRAFLYDFWKPSLGTITALQLESCLSTLRPTELRPHQDPLRSNSFVGLSIQTRVIEYYKNMFTKIRRDGLTIPTIPGDTCVQ